jgi:hypothetical protein
MHVCNPPLAVIAAKAGGCTEPKLDLLTIGFGSGHALQPVGVCNSDSTRILVDAMLLSGETL